MENCVFCKIIKGEIGAARIWEDDKFLAILDTFPNTKGMALVLPKTHYDSNAFDLSGEIYSEFFLAAKKTAKMMEKGLDVHRVALVMEGMGVNHAHIKLYPLYGTEEKFKGTWSKTRVCFEKYEGYVSTQLGPAADPEELKRLAEKIRKAE